MSLGITSLFAWFGFFLCISSEEIPLDSLDPCDVFVSPSFNNTGTHFSTIPEALRFVPPTTNTSLVVCVYPGAYNGTAWAVPAKTISLRALEGPQRTTITNLATQGSSIYTLHFDSFHFNMTTINDRSGLNTLSFQNCLFTGTFSSSITREVHYQNCTFSALPVRTDGSGTNYFQNCLLTGAVVSIANYRKPSLFFLDSTLVGISLSYDDNFYLTLQSCVVRSSVFSIDYAYLTVLDSEVHWSNTLFDIYSYFCSVKNTLFECEPGTTPTAFPVSGSTCSVLNSTRSCPFVCPENSYSPTDGVLGCQYCSHGLVVDNECNLCPAGSELIQSGNESSCDLCSPGMYSATNGSDCLPCSIDMIAPNPGATKCTFCPGYSSSYDGLRCYCYGTTYSVFFTRDPARNCELFPSVYGWLSISASGLLILSAAIRIYIYATRRNRTYTTIQ